MAEWKKVKLGELIHIKHGYAFEGKSISFDDNGIVLVTPGNFNIGGGFKEGKCKFFHSTYPKDYVLNTGDLIITMTDLSKEGDTLGYSALVPASKKRIYLHNQRIGLVDSINKDIDKYFLYWFLRTSNYQKQIVGSASGTTVKHTSPNRICDIEISLPPLPTQKKIAEVLSCLDAQIELNRRINENLEQQAQAIFKEWFVDNTKPEWKKTNIYSISNIIYGMPFASNKFNTKGEGKPIIRIRDLKDQTFTTYTTENHPKGYLLQKGDIVVGMDGEFRPYIWSNEEAWLNQRVCVFENLRKNGKAFLYFTLKPLLNRIEQIQVATTVIHIGKKDFDAFEITLPDEKTLDKFDEITTPMIDTIVSNRLENIKLARIRDTLLPKLMSASFWNEMEKTR